MPEPLAPEVASELKLCVVSAPTAVIEASSTRSVAALTTAPAPTLASFTTCGRFTVTATPRVSVSPCEAEPSAVPSESVFADDFSSTLPAAETTCTPAATLASELVETIAIVTDAATVSVVLLPSLSVESAFGVEPLPVS